MKGILLALLMAPAWALDIDEKLTLRLLKLSKTRKTILINRGIEDGLAVGDHAKFYLTTGLIARGVVVKTSPARSVWSLYRIIDPNFLFKEKVMNLKIATPSQDHPRSQQNGDRRTHSSPRGGYPHLSRCRGPGTGRCRRYKNQRGPRAGIFGQ